jgi:hypothetical protein
MELAGFTRALDDLTPADVRTIACVLDASVLTATDEITATRAILAVEEAVRSTRRRQPAAVAGHTASGAVVHAAERAGMEPSDPEVTRVARAAGQMARALVVQDVVPDATRLLFAAFAGVASVAWRSDSSGPGVVPVVATA